MYEREFAVTKCIGNTEHIIKRFREDEKEAALACGKEVAKTNTEGVITCVRARFDENGHYMNGECEVFQVWCDK